MKPTQQQMAAWLGVSQGHLSKVFRAGTTGRRSSEKLAQRLGGRWTDYITMDPQELQRAVREAMDDAARSAVN